MRRVILLLPAALLLALASATTALADNGLTPVTPRSPNAEAINDTYWMILIVTGIIFVLVEGALILFIVRFRNRGDRTQEGAQIHGASKLELSFTLVPVLILAGIISFVFVKLPDVKDVPAAAAGTSNLEIRVEGHQYYWLFKYPDGQTAVQRMVVPVNRVVELTVVSPDVIHSWWAPALGGKIDAIPGRTNHTWFKVDREGSYEVRCAELCGLEHAHMLGWVDVVSAREYSRFISAHTGASKAVGKELVAGVCAPCHGMNGGGDYGPKIQGNALMNDAKGLENLLRQGKNKMPAVGATWDDTTMKAATDYLKERFGS